MPSMMRALIFADAVLSMGPRGRLAVHQISERPLRAALRGTRAVATDRPTALLRFASCAEENPRL